MAQIKEYSAGAMALKPTETGVEAQAATGRRISSNYNEQAAYQQAEGQRIASTVTGLGNAAVNYFEQREKSHGALASAGLLNGLTQDWDAAAKSADPNDPSVAGKFRETELEPRLNKFVESFNTEGGRKWAEAHAASIREHMFTKTTADMSSLAGIAAHNNVIQSTNTFANAVRTDPSSLDFALESARSGIDTMVDASPNLSAAQAAKLKTDLGQKAGEQITRAAVQSAIESNPDAGMNLAKNPKYAQYIDANHAQSLYTQAKRAAKTDEALAKANQRQALADSTEKIMDRVTRDLYSDDPKMTAKEILAIPEGQISRAGREHLLLIAERRAEKDPLPPAVARQNFTEALGRLRNGEITDVEQIYDLQAKGDLDYTRTRQLINEFKESRTPEGETLGAVRKRFMSTMYPTLNPKDSFGNYQPEGKDRIANLEMFAAQEEARMRREGKSPHEVYDPNSPNFIRKTAGALAQGPTPYELGQAALQRLNAQNNPKNPLNQKAAPTSTDPASPQPTSAAPGEKPPSGYPDARKAKDGNWYVEKDGKFFMVETPRPPMSR